MIELLFGARVTTEDSYFLLIEDPDPPTKGRPLLEGGVLDLENFRHSRPS